MPDDPARSFHLRDREVMAVVVSSLPTGLMPRVASALSSKYDIIPFDRFGLLFITVVMHVIMIIDHGSYRQVSNRAACRRGRKKIAQIQPRFFGELASRPIPEENVVPSGAAAARSTQRKRIGRGRVGACGRGSRSTIAPASAVQRLRNAHSHYRCHIALPQNFVRKASDELRTAQQPHPTKPQRSL